MSFIRITIIHKGEHPREEKLLYKKKTNAVEHAKCIDDFTCRHVHEKPTEYLFSHGSHAMRSRIEKVLTRLDQQAKSAHKFDWKVEFVRDNEVGGIPASPGSASPYLGGLKTKPKY